MNPLEESLYEIAAAEVANKAFRPGVWAKAFTDADGDERKAAARYIDIRVEQFRAELESQWTQKEEAETRRREVARNQQRRCLVATSRFFGFTFQFTLTELRAEILSGKIRLDYYAKWPDQQEWLSVRLLGF